MLTRLHRIIRRRRRTLMGVLVLMTLAFAGAVAHAAAMADHAHADPVSDAVVTCIAIGGSMAIAAGAAIALRLLRHRPLWRLAEPAALSDALRLVVPHWLVRAGPPARLQVFRL